MGDNRFESGHMKSGVYSPHHRWKLEMNCGGADDLDDVEQGPTKRRASFLVPPRMGISLVESHTCCPTQISGSWNSPSVRKLFHPGRRSDEISVCDSPGSLGIVL